LIPVKNWKKLSFGNNSSYKDGIIWELTGKENKKVIEFLTFKNNNEFNLVVSILKKYGLNTKNIEDNEVEHLEKFRKGHNWMDKQEGDMEW
jgi:hypothetical protein